MNYVYMVRRAVCVCVDVYNNTFKAPNRTYLTLIAYKLKTYM